MNFDLGKQKKEAKGIDPPQLRSYFQASARGAFRVMSGGPPKAHLEAWKVEGVEGPNADYNEGGFLILRVDRNDADDFDATNAIAVAREGDDEFSSRAIALLDKLEAEHEETKKGAATATQ